MAISTLAHLAALQTRLAELARTCDRLALAATKHAELEIEAREAADHSLAAYHRVQVDYAIDTREIRAGQLSSAIVVAEMEIDRQLGIAARAADRAADLAARAGDWLLRLDDRTAADHRRHLSRCRRALDIAYGIWLHIPTTAQGASPLLRHEQRNRG